MQFRTTAILAAIFVVLFGFVYFVELRKPEDKSKTPGLSQTPIWSLTPDQVARITIRDNTNQKTAEVAREGGVWNIKQPIQEPADDTRLNSLAGQVARLSATRVISEPGADLGAFGLAQPKFTLQVGLNAGAEEVLQLGDTTPDGAATYARHEGAQPIYLVQTFIINDLKNLITNPPKKPTPTPTATDTPIPAETATPITTPSLPEPTVTPTA